MIEGVKHQANWKEVMGRARRLDPDAFDRLVEEYAPRVRGFLRRIVTGSDLDDLVQEVFLRMVRTIADYREEGRLDAWVFQIARNLARDELRRSNREMAKSGLATIPQVATADAEDNLDRVETVRKMEIAIARLPEAEREVVLLRHFGRLTFEQIADMMGTPLGTALARAHRGLARLRQWMESPHD